MFAIFTLSQPDNRDPVRVRFGLVTRPVVFSRSSLNVRIVVNEAQGEDEAQVLAGGRGRRSGGLGGRRDRRPRRQTGSRWRAAGRRVVLGRRACADALGPEAPDPAPGPEAPAQAQAEARPSPTRTSASPRPSTPSPVPTMPSPHPTTPSPHPTTPSPAGPPRRSPSPRRRARLPPPAARARRPAQPAQNWAWCSTGGARDVQHLGRVRPLQQRVEQQRQPGPAEDLREQRP